jgi:NAD-dependent SIR2 family protein deacetylase
MASGKPGGFSIEFVEDFSDETGPKSFGSMLLRQRPKAEFVNHTNEELSCSPKPSDLVYIRSCTSCTVTIGAMAAKCIVEACKDVTVRIEKRLCAGMLEIINSSGVVVDINPQFKLPTITIDLSNDVCLKYHLPQMIGCVYTTSCRDVRVCLDPPYKETHPLDLPAPEDTSQYVSEYKINKMKVDKVIREGAGYPTTAEKKERDDKKQELIKRQIEAYVLSLFKDKPKEKPVTEKESGNTDTPPSKEKPVPEAVEVSPDARCERPSKTIPNASELLETKGKLKPTETHVRNTPIIPDSKPKPKPFNPAIEDEEDKKEFFDSKKDLDKKVKEIAGYIKSSRYTMMFTGAGISTSTGIPDFRSGMKTVLETGPGVWELRDQQHKLSAAELGDIKKKKSVSLVRALPSVTHMSIVKLHQEGLVSLTVSQNVDGLHRRSNIDPKFMAELHGNTNLERCKKCGHEYMRDYGTRTARHVFSHETGRQCDNPECRGVLLDSIVNFGENLPEHEVTKAFNGADKADVCIVLGSSLRVSPACDIPRMVKKRGGKLIICNLQKTPLHGMADVNVHALCDEFMTKLMAELQVDIPVFKLHRRVRIAVSDKTGKQEMSVCGMDPHDDSPYSFIKGIVASSEPHGKVFESAKEPFTFDLPKGNSSVKLQLYFHGHYNEPSLHLNVPRKVGSALYNLRYQPGTDIWESDVAVE